MSTLIKATKRNLLLHSRKSSNVFSSVGEFAWRGTATCQIDGRISCHVERCTVGFQRGPDGICKQTRTLHVAVYTADKKLEEKEHEHLVGLILCLLASRTSIDIAEGIPPKLSKIDIDGRVLHGAVLSY